MTIPKHVNPDLVNERKKATFDVEEFTAFIHDGESFLQLKRLAGELLIKKIASAMRCKYHIILCIRDIYTYVY